MPLIFTHFKDCFLISSKSFICEIFLDSKIKIWTWSTWPPTLIGLHSNPLYIPRYIRKGMFQFYCQLMPDDFSNWKLYEHKLLKVTVPYFYAYALTLLCRSGLALRRRQASGGRWKAMQGGYFFLFSFHRAFPYVAAVALSGLSNPSNYSYISIAI